MVKVRILVSLILMYGLIGQVQAETEAQKKDQEQVEKSEDVQAEIQKQLEPGVIILDRVMVIGNPDRIDEIPGSAYYIDKATLDKQNHNDINRILREVPGINLQEEDGYGLRPNIGIRGTGSERSSKITVMEDGILMAPAPYVAPAAYYFPTAGRMQSIEIRKGSSQIKHGPYTTGGALNMRSTPIPYDLTGRAHLTIGENSSRNIWTSAGDAYGNFGWLVETYQTKVDGFKHLDGGGNTGFDKKDYMAKFRFNTHRDAGVYQELMLKLGQTDEVSDETYLGLTDEDFKRTPYRRYAASRVDQMNTKHRQFQVRYFVQPGGSFDFTAIFYRNTFHRNWYKLDRIRAAADGNRAKIAAILEDPVQHAAEYAIVTGSTSPNNNALEVKANNRDYYAQGVQSVLGLQTDRGSVTHHLEVGLRFHKDQIDRFQWVDLYKMDNGVMQLTGAGTKGTESNRIETATAFASYLHYKLTCGNLSATPGLRYENVKIERKDYGKSDPGRTGSSLTTRENSIDVWIPGLGLNYRFSPSTRAFVGIHKGFAPPGSKDGTRPENSINYELGLHYGKDALDAQAVVYLNDYGNLLGADLAAAGGTGSGDQFNGGEAVARGLELGLRYDLGNASGALFSIPFRIAYTYTSAEFRHDFESDFEPWGTVKTGDEIPYIPRHQIFAGLGIENGRWGVDLSAKYTGEMRTKAGSGRILALESTQAHFTVDASAEVALSPKAKLFGRVRNLTNKTYIAARRPAGVRPGMPRTFMAGIKTDF